MTTSSPIIFLGVTLILLNSLIILLLLCKMDDCGQEQNTPRDAVAICKPLKLLVQHHYLQ